MPLCACDWTPGRKKCAWGPRSQSFCFEEGELERKRAANSLLKKHRDSVLTHICGIQKDGNADPACETAKETQMNRTVSWTLWEWASVGWFERIALKHVYYHMWNRSLVQVRCMRQGAQGWCTGMTQRNGMGRNVGGRVQNGEYMYTRGRFMSMYGKTNIIL